VALLTSFATDEDALTSFAALTALGRIDIAAALPVAREVWAGGGFVRQLGALMVWRRAGSTLFEPLLRQFAVRNGYDVEHIRSLVDHELEQAADRPYAGSWKD
jgi:hypothetical protein